MSLNFDNTNYYEALSPTGRDIQGIVPIKKYYVLNTPFKQPINSVVANIPICYREGVTDHSNQIIYLLIVRTGGGLLQPFLKNSTEHDIDYITIIDQQYRNDIQQKKYYQRDNDYTHLPKNTTNQNSFLQLQSMGTSTTNNNGGNDRGNFNINIKINNHNLNVIGSWYTPLVTSLTDQNNDNLNGWLTLETVDNYLNLV